MNSLSEQLTPVPAEPLIGKTYSLRPDTSTSDAYYSAIAHLADTLLRQSGDLPKLLETVRWLTMSKRHLQRLLRSTDSSSDKQLIELLRTTLSKFTRTTSEHLKHLKGFERFDRTMAATEGQYHLYMVEIELANRLYRDAFLRSPSKFAFLPHCLRDLKADCQSAFREIDYICKGCTDDCTLNRVSKMLRRHQVKPFIWMEADLKGVFRRMKSKGDTPGVLGIACVPELSKGMRLCHKYGVPAIGIPLDANRCARWWGKFLWNSVNFGKLENLLEPR